MAGPGALLLLSCSYACKCSCSLSGAHVLSQRAAGATGLTGPSGSTCCPMHAWGVRSQAAAGTKRGDSRPIELPSASVQTQLMQGTTLQSSTEPT